MITPCQEVVDADLCDESLDMEFWAAVGEN